MIDATPEVRLIAPNYVKYNSTAELTCDHTVALDDLHKVEFLKDNKKILEYIRDRTDPFRKSPPAGLEFEVFFFNLINKYLSITHIMIIINSFYKLYV